MVLRVPIIIRCDRDGLIIFLPTENPKMRADIVYVNILTKICVDSVVGTVFINQE
jgi:hypothetical protein